MYVFVFEAEIPFIFSTFGVRSFFSQLPHNDTKKYTNFSAPSTRK